MSATPFKILTKTPSPDGTGWRAEVELPDAQRALVFLYRGRRVRVAFKPRSFVGFKWYGRVMLSGRIKWEGEVTKSTGVAFMLEQAELIDRGRCGRVTFWSAGYESRWFGHESGRVAVCKNIKPKGWTERWCPSCMQALDRWAREFYADTYSEWTEVPWFNKATGNYDGHTIQLVPRNDDTIGRWENDGGLAT